MKGVRFLFIAIAAMLAWSVTACDNGHEEPDQIETPEGPDDPDNPDNPDDGGATDSVAKKDLNIYDFNGYYFKGLDDRYKEENSYKNKSANIVYSPIKDRKDKLLGMIITLDSFNAGSVTLYTDTYRTDIGSSENDNFEVNDDGTLSNIMYKKHKFSDGITFTSIEDYTITFNFEYDEGRLIKVESKIDFTEEFWSQYQEINPTFYTSLTQSVYNLKWVGDNLTEIDYLYDYTSYTNDEFSTHKTSDARYFIEYGNEVNPALQYPYSLANIFTASSSLDLAPLVGFVGNGPAYLPVNISYIASDDKSDSYDISFLTGDVQGMPCILKETFNDHAYTYKYGLPF